MTAIGNDESINVKKKKLVWFDRKKIEHSFEEYRIKIVSKKKTRTRITFHCDCFPFFKRNIRIF